MSVPNPIIVDADVVITDLSVDAEVESEELLINSEAASALQPMPHITIGDVETTAETATASMTGTYADPVLNLGIPRGPKGDKGDKGDAGSLNSITADIDANVGTPAVTVEYDGANAAFHFSNLKGAKGDPGQTGAAATIAVGNVSSGSTASVTNSGTSGAAVFDFVLPKGDKGDPGSSGAAATIAVGSVSSGSTASVTNSGTSAAAVFDFVLPKGDTGQPGTAATIAVGSVTSGSTASVTNSGTSSAAVFDFVLPKGDTGTGIPSGGTDGQLVGKSSGAIAWVNPPKEVFIAEYNTTTFAEITAALNEGKFVVCKRNYVYAPLFSYQASSSDPSVYLYYFMYASASGTGTYYVRNTDVWGNSTYDMVRTTRTINGKALSSNITLTASDVGALPDSTTIPTKVSDLTNDSGFVTAAGAASAAPVQSVNGQTGTVTLSIPTVPTNVSSFNNDAGYLTLSTLPVWDGSVT